jgi:hypothetical protein
MTNTKDTEDAEMAILRRRSEIAELSDDTTLQPHQAATYLGISAKKLEAMRSSVQPSGPPFIKLVDKTSKARNQSVFYKLGDLRRYQDEFRVKSSHEAALKTDIYKFTRLAHTFYAEKGTGALLREIVDFHDLAEREEIFLRYLQGSLRVRRLTLCDAVHAEWSDARRHSKLRDEWARIIDRELKTIRG